MKKFLGSLFAVAVVMASPAVAAPVADFEGLAHLIQRVKDTTQHPSGTAVAVVKDGKVIYEGYFGYADINARTRVDRDTSFYIASATKPFLEHPAERGRRQARYHDLVAGRIPGDRRWTPSPSGP